MTTQKIYQLPVEVTNWKFDGATEIAFNWEYEDGSADLLSLYEKGKQQQWDTSDPYRLDPGAVRGQPDGRWPTRPSRSTARPSGTKMTEKEKNWLRFNLQCHSICQFMHGEQGALIATAKIVTTVPDMNAKFYAATQVMDEARHVESYKRLIHEKFKSAYPITDSLKNLLEQTLSDRRWDMTYLGMQVLIEGLALAAFQRIRDSAKNNLGRRRERLRHAGRGAPRHVRPHGAARVLPAPLRRRARRARGVRGRGALLHARPLQPGRGLDAVRPAGEGDAGARLPFGRHAGVPHAACSPASCRSSRRSACSGPKVQKALGDMGVMGYAEIDVEQLIGNDLKVADDFDAKKFVNDQIAAE